MHKDARLKKFFISILLMFVVTIAVSTGILTYAIITRCEKYMLTETQALVASNAEQLGLNVNAHMDSIEGNVALMFADDDIVNYDSSTSLLDEYDRINMEESIRDRISELGTLENYSDFCIAYADDNVIGWESKTTQNLFEGGGIYDEFSSYISDEKTMDAWIFGVKGNIDRMYYVKRCNQNAVIIASFYTRELESTFRYPDELQGMTVRLVSDEGYIVYSSDSGEIGIPVSEQNMEYMEEGMTINAITDSQLINTHFCENGWMLMCTVSRDNMMREFYSLKHFAVFISIAVILIAAAIIIFIFRKLFKPMDGYVGALSERATVDLLSGVLSRRGFKDNVEADLSEAQFDDAAFLMLDIDNFKKANDTFGHDRGDEIISRMGRLLTDSTKQQEGVKILIGRLGGDEFAIFMEFSEGFGSADPGEGPSDSGEGMSDEGHSAEKSRECAEALLARYIDAFGKEFSGEEQEFALSVSGGFAMKSDTDGDYHSMYIAADSALYISKKNGKNRYTCYREGKTDES